MRVAGHELHPHGFCALCQPMQDPLAVALLAANQPDNSAMATRKLRTPNTFAAGAPLPPGTSPLLRGD